MLRKLFLLLIAFWLPVQAGSALAMSIGMPGLPQQHDAAAMAHDHHEAMEQHHSGHAGAAAAVPHDGHEQHGASGGCERCGLCQFVHGGVMLNAGMNLPAVPFQSVFALQGDERFRAHIPELLQRPPLSAA
jgi:hypothetical protein